MKTRKKRSVIIAITSIVLIVTAVVIFLIATAKDNGGSEVYYTEDYAKSYAKTLRVMFGDDYIISEPYDTSMQNPVHGDEEQTIYFTSWDISYQDGNGNTQNFYMSNRSPLSHWIKQHAATQIETYYSQIFEEEFKEIPLWQSTGIYANIAKISCNRTDVPEMCEKTDAYLENLSTPDGSIRFCELTQENAFELIPLYLDVHVFLDEQLSGSEITEYRESAEAAAERFVGKLNAVTAQQANISLIVGQSSGDVPDTRKYYIQGNNVDASSFYFERDIFEVYKEKFFD